MVVLPLHMSRQVGTGHQHWPKLRKAAAHGRQSSLRSLHT